MELEKPKVYDLGGSAVSTITTENFSLALKQGWNAVYVKGISQASISGSATGTETITLENPSLNWVLINNF